jgi:hypothetical protein
MFWKTNMLEGCFAFTYNYMQFNALLCTYMYLIGASSTELNGMCCCWKYVDCPWLQFFLGEIHIP